MKPFTPDYIRFGSRICMVTWARLIALACFLFLLAMFFGPTATGDQVGEAALALPRRETTGAVLRRAAGAVVGRLKTLAGGTDGKGKGSPAGAARVDIMRPWCALPPAASLGASQAWKPAALGTASWPAAEGDKGVACDWAGKTTTQVSFQVCTFSRDKDTQVSAYIHKEGHWSGWKKGMAEEFLPVLDSAEAWNAVEGRTLVLDIGANLGFYTLLAATRGYDVFAFEPSSQCIERLLLSLSRNSVQVVASNMDTPAQVAPFTALDKRQAEVWAKRASKAGEGLVAKRAKEAEKLGRRAGLAAAAAGSEEGGAPRRAAAAVGGEGGEEGGVEGRVRKASAWVFNNAVSDSYALQPFAFIEDNPGASFVPWGGSEKDKEGIAWVGAVPLDDLLAPGSREPGLPPPSKALPALEPERVRFIKVSAEGMDSRILHGLRRLLSLGRVPFVIFVYNDAHIKEHGCNPAEFVGTLVDHGYRMWHAGIFYARLEDVARFLRGQGTAANPKSTELVFVGPGVEWA